jgi:hypothetical protein
MLSECVNIDRSRRTDESVNKNGITSLTTGLSEPLMTEKVGSDSCFVLTGCSHGNVEKPRPICLRLRSRDRGKFFCGYRHRWDVQMSKTRVVQGTRAWLCRRRGCFYESPRGEVTRDLVSDDSLHFFVWISVRNPLQARARELIRVTVGGLGRGRRLGSAIVDEMPGRCQDGVFFE